MEQLTVKKFLLKKFPTNKYMDCPVPKHHWEVIQEYAEAYHESLKSEPPNEPSIQEDDVTKKADYLWDKWALTYDNHTYLTKDLFLLALQDNKFTQPQPIQEDETIAKEYATGMMGLGEYNEKWDYEDQVLFNTIVKAVKYVLQKTQPQPLQEDCTCTPDQTTGHTAGKCNVCGKDIEESAIQHADSLHKKGSSELAGNGKLTENDCWENAYFNFKEGSKQLNK